jgi:stage 0 sporulation regulatory protein
MGIINLYNGDPITCSTSGIFITGEMNMLELMIEEKREKMIVLAMELGFTAQETVVCSQELDQLINIKLTSHEFIQLPVHMKHEAHILN